MLRDAGLGDSGGTEAFTAARKLQHVLHFFSLQVSGAGPSTQCIYPLACESSRTRIYSPRALSDREQEWIVQRVRRCVVHS